MTQDAGAVDTSPPPLATLALALTVEDWNVLGLGSSDPATAPTSDLDVLVERTTALFLVRIAALVAPLGHYPDLSTSNICRHILMNKKTRWPTRISTKVQDQLRDFCKRILSGYKDVPYHNREHGFHMLLSVNKLMDLMVAKSSTGAPDQKVIATFGLRNDPLALFAVLFAALIHDVEHQGIPNRQLALEDDRLAILYNDQSIAENWSIYVAFSEFLQDDFKDLRKAIFQTKEDYQKFRKIVVNLVLTTDIASPERTQIAKSKWKEAFGDPYETIERKTLARARRMSLSGQDVNITNSPPGQMARRGTGEVSEISFSRHTGDDEDSISDTPENSENGGYDNAVPGSHFLAPDLGGMTSATPDRFERRRSSMASRGTATSKYRQRLGIMRTVDLSGETLISYPRSGSIEHSVSTSDQPFSVDLDDDEPNELRAAVVMETIIAAADVAHNLQGWDHMAKFSSRLYLELRKAFVEKRGADPEPRWFENQIGFLESYLLPLAHRLEDTGVFSEEVGMSFPTNVERNRDKWLTHGFANTQATIAKGAEIYPLKE